MDAISESLRSDSLPLEVMRLPIIREVTNEVAPAVELPILERLPTAAFYDQPHIRYTEEAEAGDLETSTVMDAMRAGAVLVMFESRLTDLQVRVIEKAAEGKTNDRISRELDASDNTAKEQMGAILRKLRAPDRARAVLLAFRRGYIR